MYEQQRTNPFLRWTTMLVLLGLAAWGGYRALDTVRNGAAEGAARSAVVVGRDAPETRLEVVFWGDSLGWESREVIAQRLQDRDDIHFVARTFGGTAPCDWLPDMAARAATVDIAVIQFSGNAFSNCLRDPATGALPVGGGVATAYEQDVTYAAELFTARGAAVVLVGSPPPRDPGVDDPRLLVPVVFRTLSERLSGVEYVDAGKAVLDHGRWTATLPCLPTETGGEGCRGDRVPVRAEDGLHLCPAIAAANAGIVGSCAQWSSGAQRFGRAIADAIEVQAAAR
jgi:hypothetical protein